MATSNPPAEPRASRYVIATYPEVLSDNFSRPANTTQYASGDLVANNATAASVSPLSWAGGPCIVRRARMAKDDDDTTAAQFRLHLFGADPTGSAPANGDNDALSLNTTITDYLGAFDFDMTTSPDVYNTAGNQAVGVPLYGNEIIVGGDVSLIYGLLEARATYTPASGETFTVLLERLRA